jgi:hypothetical protein
MISAAENEKNKKRIKEDFYASKSKITALVGLSKNAGKTSFLNWLTSTLFLAEAGIITTGRDGEDFDLISKQQKPKVLVPASYFFSTWTHQISVNSPYMEVLERLPYKAAGKSLWLVKAKTHLHTEVVGPASVFEQIELAKKILSCGAKHVFIDGSLDRKSIVLARELEQFFLIVSPALGSFTDILQETGRVVTLASIPTEKSIELYSTIAFHNGKKCVITDFETLLGNEKEITTLISTEKKVVWFFIPGVITERMLQMLKPLFYKYKCSLYMEHPFQLLLSASSLLGLSGNVYTKRQSRLCGIAVNSFSANGNHIDSQELLSEMQNQFKPIPVVDIYSL